MCCFNLVFECFMQIKVLQIVIFYKMVDHNIYVGDTNKLERNFNY